MGETGGAGVRACGGVVHHQAIHAKKIATTRCSNVTFKVGFVRSVLPYKKETAYEGSFVKLFEALVCFIPNKHQIAHPKQRCVSSQCFQNFGRSQT